MKKFEIFVDGQFVGMLDKATAEEAISAFVACKANNYSGGLVTATEYTGDQSWDFLAND
jgi:hypothetical protein